MKEELIGKFKRGSSTLELLIALAVITISITAGISVVFGNQSISIDTETNGEALSKAIAILEKARADSRNDYGLISGNTETEVSGPITYTKNLSVSENGDSKVITGMVGWPLGGRGLAVSLSTKITNFQNPSAACSPTLSGDWTSPTMRSYEFGKDLLVPSDPSSGFPITDVFAASNKLYVTVNNTHGNNNGTLFGFDISDPGLKPQFLFSIDNSPSVGEGLNAVTIFGHYAYVTNAYTGSSATCAQGSNCAQLQIIDLNNLALPIVNLKIPAVASGNKLAPGTAIFYSRGYIYIGLALASGSGSEFYIVDVGGGGSPASPTNPVLKGNYKVGSGVNGIFVKDNFAYIASPNAENITIVDISDPNSPFRVGGYTPAGSNNGKSVYVKDGIIYLGRTFGTNELYLLNSSDASVNNFKDIGTGNGTSINGLIVRENLAFLITNLRFEIWNVSGSISQYSTPLTLPGGSGTAIGCKGNYIYVGSLPSNDKGYVSIVGPKSEFALSNDGDIAVIQGQSGTTNINETLVSGLSLSKTFSASGLPSGATASFTNNPCTPTCSSVLTISTSFPTTPPGTYTITVNDSGSLTTTFNLTVSPQPFDYNLTNSGDITVAQGLSGANTVTRTLTSGTSQAVSLSASGLPSGATASFTNNPCTPTCSSVLTISTSASTPAGTYSITITGTGGKTTIFNLVVNPSFDYSISVLPASTSLIRAGASVSSTVTITKLQGITQSVTVTPSGLPSGVTASPASASCTPSSSAPFNCILIFNYTASATAAIGSKSVNVNGNPPSHTTTFTMSVSAPSFDYTISSSPNPLPIVRAGSSVSSTVLITMTPGAVPQSVSVTPSNIPTGVSVSPLSSSCTPSAATPYTCSIVFNYSASASTALGSHNVLISGTSPAHSINLTLNVSAPAFDYSLSVSNSNLTINRGSSGTNTVTVTMIPGAVAQSVSITFSNLQQNVSVSPSPGSCSPVSGTCSVLFTITAASNAQRKTNTITVTGVSPSRSTTFQLTIP